MELALVLVVWVVSAAVGGTITDYKGRGWGLGIVLGILLGVVGIVIALLLSNKQSRRRAAPAPSVVPQPTSLYRECPHCREELRRDASVCPHCRRESDPWQFHAGAWWVQEDTGDWIYLDEETHRWRRHRVQAPVPPVPPGAGAELVLDPDARSLSPGGQAT